MMKRVSAGLGALILSAVLLVGLPAALVFLAGNPIPSWDRLVSALTMPDYGGEFLIGTVIPLVAWIAWATFAIGYLAEIPNQLRAAAAGPRVKRVNLPGFGLQQKAAGILIAAIIAIFAPNVAMAATPSVAEAAPATVASSVLTHAQTGGQNLDEAPATAEADQSAQLYTVKAGDSLWAIAEHFLGDGQRYGEIIDLNRDTPQPGGYTVGQRDGIDPGMVLTLPTSSTPAAAPAAATETEQHTVVSGDTLWDIADAELGSGDRYEEIFEASRDLTQPGGAHLTDPNLILPGWTVVIPGATATTTETPAPAPAENIPDESTTTVPPADEETAAPADEAAQDAPAGADQSQSTSGLGFVTGEQQPSTEAPAAQSAPEADLTVSDEAENTDSPAWVDIVSDWRTLGIGGVLAAGLLAFLGLRRIQQRRNRKPGQRIAMPTEEISNVELELRAVENPQGMDAVDHALRMLAVWAQDTSTTLPALYALRLSENEISIFLDEPTQLPAPFHQDTDDEMAWSISFDELTPLERIPSAPYPALVTLGHDDNDAHLLVDLEKLGSLNIEGTPELEQAALTALALELTTSTWAENLQVTLVGIADELPEAIGSGRVRHVDNIDNLLHGLRAQAEEVTTALAEAGITSLEQARTAGPLAESWTPEIIVLGQLPDEQTRVELAELVTRVPRVGIAAITAGHLAGGWNFRLHDRASAELEIPDSGDAVLPLTPQVVTREEYDRILALFTVANDAPATEHMPASAEIDLDEIITSVPTTDSNESTVTDAGTEDLAEEDLTISTPVADAVPAAAPHEDEGDITVADAEELSPVLVDEAASASEDEDEDEDEELAPIVNLRSPRLQLLGPVTVLNPMGQEPGNAQQWNSQRLRAIELIAFVATHPDASTEQVHDALWPGSDPVKGTSSRNRLTTAARRWLGKDAAGHSYLVPATKGQYNLTETFTQDWADWLALVGEDPTKASTPNLVRALGMVKGQPLSGIKEKYYVWSETLRQEIIAAVGDAAHELATRALHEGDTRNARMAAAIGRMVDPINEVYWRDALRAEHMAGDIAGVERLVTQLEHALTQVDPDYAEPEPDTEQLIAQLRQRHTIAS